MIVDTDVIAAKTEAEYEAMTLAELQAEFVRLAPAVTVLQNARHAMNAIIERRVREVKARERVIALSDQQKEALKVALDPAARDAEVVPTK